MRLLRGVSSLLVAGVLVSCSSATPTPSPLPATPGASPTQNQATASFASPTAALATASPEPGTATPTAGPTQAPSATPTLEPSPTPAATSTSIPQAEGLIVIWVPVQDPGLGVVYSVDGVASNGAQMAAFGEAGQDLTTVTWYSADGRTWSQADFPDSAISTIALQSMTAGGPGFVIVGQDFNTTQGLVYISADGHSWQRVDSDVLAGQSLTWVGSVNGTVTAFSEEGRAFTSPDGLTWQQDTDASAATVAAGMVALHGDGTTLWAVTRDQSEPKPSQRLLQVWSSVDGRTWSETGTVDGSKGADSVWLSHGNLGYALIANTFHQDTSVWQAWQSADGSTWVPASNSPRDVTDVIATDAGFVAVGHYNTGGGCAISETDDVGVTWTSVDGLLWQQMPIKGWKAREVQVVTQSGPALFGLGVDYKPYFDNKDSGVVWTFDVPGSAGEPGTPSPTPTPTPNQGCGP